MIRILEQDARLSQLAEFYKLMGNTTRPKILLALAERGALRLRYCAGTWFERGGNIASTEVATRSGVVG